MYDMEKDGEHTITITKNEIKICFKLSHTKPSRLKR